MAEKAHGLQAWFVKEALLADATATQYSNVSPSPSLHSVDRFFSPSKSRSLPSRAAPVRITPADIIRSEK